MRRVLVICALGLSTLSAGRAAAASSAERVFVLDLVASGVEPTLARNLSEVVALSFRRARPDGQVMAQSDIDSVLAVEKQRDLLGCEDDVACLTEIGGALGAGEIVVGSLGKVGSTLLLTLKLVDARAGKTLRHVSEEIRSEEVLLEAARQWSTHLASPETKAGYGYIDVRGTGPVTVDGVPAGRAPRRLTLVAPGSHRVQWQEPRPLEVQVEVLAYSTSRAEPLGRAPAVETEVERTPALPKRGWFATALVVPNVLVSYRTDDNADNLGQEPSMSRPYVAWGARAGYVLESGLALHLELVGTATSDILLSVGDQRLEKVYPMNFLTPSLGIGWVAGDRLRLTPAFSLGLAQLCNDVPWMGGEKNSALVKATPELGVSYVLRDAFEVGLKLGAGYYFGDDNGTRLVALETAITFGIPAGGSERAIGSARNPWLWATAVGIGGGVAMAIVSAVRARDDAPYVRSY